MRQSKFNKIAFKLNLLGGVVFIVYCITYLLTSADEDSYIVALFSFGIFQLFISFLWLVTFYRWATGMIQRVFIYWGLSFVVVFLAVHAVWTFDFSLMTVVAGLGLCLSFYNYLISYKLINVKLLPGEISEAVVID